MSTKDELERVKARIADPQRWTRLVCARNAGGEEVGSNDPDATCWCFVGACTKEGVKGETVEMIYLAMNKYPEFENLSRGILNDAMGHDAVMRVLDRAITLAGEQP
jgi:hypothetical protein